MKKIIQLILISIFTLCISSCSERKYLDVNKKNKSIMLPTFINVDRKTIPSTKDPLVIRTNFSNDKEWEIICKEILTPHPDDEFIPYLVFLNNNLFQNFSEKDLITDSLTNYYHSFIFIVDEKTITHKEHPILCVGLKNDLGLKFRVIPSMMWAIENNLSISNVDFEYIVNSVESDGIYRGEK